MKSIIIIIFVTFTISCFSQSKITPTISTSQYNSTSASDMNYLVRIAKERRCNQFIRSVKNGAELTNKYMNYNSESINNVKFYEGVNTYGNDVYFAIVQFETNSGRPSKEYIYSGNKFTEENYKNNYKVSAGDAFYDYIYKYNTDKECSYNNF